MPSTDCKPKAADSINLLSLDGGGIRGASILIILKEMMRRMTLDLHPDWLDTYMDNDPRELKPCDVFDMIGGSGTGGIIAILLGRLGLSVGDATKHYSALVQHLFKNGYTRETMGDLLEEKMKSIVKQYVSDGDAKMVDTEKRGCKTFVVAYMVDNMSSPINFRTYRAQMNPTPNCCIWQAVRATTANRKFYKDVKISGLDKIPITYVGTEYGKNNPTECVVEEAKKVFNRRKLSSLISIGAGHPGVISMTDRTAKGLQASLEQLVRDCEQIADAVEGKYLEEEDEKGYNPYTRFSVTQGMQNMAIADMDIPAKVKAHTMAYLQEHKVSRVVDKAIRTAKDRAQEKQDVIDMVLC